MRSSIAWLPRMPTGSRGGGGVIPTSWYRIGADTQKFQRNKVARSASGAPIASAELRQIQTRLASCRQGLSKRTMMSV